MENQFEAIFEYLTNSQAMNQQNELDNSLNAQNFSHHMKASNNASKIWGSGCGSNESIPLDFPDFYEQNDKKMRPVTSFEEIKFNNNDSNCQDVDLDISLNLKGCEDDGPDFGENCPMFTSSHETQSPQSTLKEREDIDAFLEDLFSTAKETSPKSETVDYNQRAHFLCQESRSFIKKEEAHATEKTNASQEDADRIDELLHQISKPLKKKASNHRKVLKNLPGLIRNVVLQDYIDFTQMSQDHHSYISTFIQKLDFFQLQDFHAFFAEFDRQKYLSTRTFDSLFESIAFVRGGYLFFRLVIRFLSSEGKRAYDRWLSSPRGQEVKQYLRENVQEKANFVLKLQQRAQKYFPKQQSFC